MLCLQVSLRTADSQNNGLDGIDIKLLISPAVLGNPPNIVVTKRIIRVSPSVHPGLSFSVFLSEAFIRIDKNDL